MSFRSKALIGSTVAVAIATPFVADWEGLSTKPYKDPVGIWTVCYGETNVEMREYTKAECDAMLNERVTEFYNDVVAKITYDEVPATMQAAITSYAYNVGIGAYSNSTLLKKINRGDLIGACYELDRWVYAGGMWLRGLANRRAVEKELCLLDLKPQT